MRQPGTENRSESVCNRTLWMLHSCLIALSALVFLANPGILSAQTSVDVKVSATIPPTPCRYPEACHAIARPAESRVMVRNGVVTYVGTRPTVIRRSDRLIILL